MPFPSVLMWTTRPPLALIGFHASVASQRHSAQCVESVHACVPLQPKVPTHACVVLHAQAVTTEPVQWSTARVDSRPSLHVHGWLSVECRSLAHSSLLELGAPEEHPSATSAAIPHKLVGPSFIARTVFSEWTRASRGARSKPRYQAFCLDGHRARRFAAQPSASLTRDRESIEPSLPLWPPQRAAEG